MRFYNQRHEFYCGIDLHARKIYVCIIDAQGKTKLHQNLDSDPALLFDAIFPHLEDVVIKDKALGIYSHKLGRAIYFMLKNKSE